MEQRIAFVTLRKDIRAAVQEELAYLDVPTAGRGEERGRALERKWPVQLVVDPARAVRILTYLSAKIRAAVQEERACINLPGKGRGVERCEAVVVLGANIRSMVQKPLTFLCVYI